MGFLLSFHISDVEIFIPSPIYITFELTLFFLIILVPIILSLAVYIATV